MPSWLLSLTGDPSRMIPLSFDKTRNEMSPQSASSFVVPACDSCNNGFAPLEADAQGVVETLLDDGDVDELEISQLLDWFDKVRIGLWGADLMRNPGHSFVDRKLTVANRMGQKDRCLLVARTSCQERGLSFSGTWSPSFHATPSCFGLAINNLYFFNLSYEHAFSHRLGFPALVDRRFTAERLVAGDVRPGSGKTRLPVLKREVALDCLSIFQPCFGCPSMSETPDSFDSEFTQHHTLDATTGRGRNLRRVGGTFLRAEQSSLSRTQLATGYPRAFAQVAMKFVVADLGWIDDLLPSTYLLVVGRTAGLPEAESAGSRRYLRRDCPAAALVGTLRVSGGPSRGARCRSLSTPCTPPRAPPVGQLLLFSPSPTAP